MGTKKEIAEMIVNNAISTALNKKKDASMRKRAIIEIYNLCVSGHLEAKRAVEVLIEIGNEETSEDFLGVVADARATMHKILNEMKDE
ncbi:MAG: hypothetical protein WA063_04085 [Minisyncoccia bacterium]